MRIRATTLGAILVLSACQPPAAVTGRGGPKATPSPARVVALASPAGVASPAALLPSPAPSVAAPPITPIVSNNSATLVGKVKAPAPLLTEGGLGIVGNNSAGVVSNNGAGLLTEGGLGIVGNNGAGYRLAATTDQVAVAGATVQLLDAAGQPVTGPDGKPLTAVTDKDGNYAFKAVLPARNLLVAVNLKGGQLAGYVPKAAASVDLDLISTLSTGYVVRLYVQSQPHPQDVLEKLPATLEADTRAKTAAAFVAGSVPVPDALTSERVVAAVQRLRKADAALNAKLEEVKCLLVLAGQCDLGEGQLATDLKLGAPWGIPFTPDGHLLANDWLGDRVWRLDDDGRVRALLKGISTDLVNKDDTRWRAPRVVGYDRQGRAVVIDQGVYNQTGTDASRVSLLGADGNPIVLWRGPLDPIAVAIGDGELRLLTTDGKWLVVAEGKAPRQDGQLRAQDLPLVGVTKSVGQDRGGRLWLCSFEVATGGYAVYRYDPASQGVVKVVGVDDQKASGPAGIRKVALDAAGNIFEQTYGGALSVHTPEGRTIDLATALPANLVIDAFRGVALGPDGAGYFATLDGVYQVANGTATLVLGTGGKVSNTSSLVQFEPYALATGPNGNIYASDIETHKLYKLTPDGTASVIAGGGEFSLDDGPATSIGLGSTHVLALDPRGRLFFQDVAVRRLDPDGSLHTVARIPDQHFGSGLAVVADGTCYYGVRDGGSTTFQIFKLGADGTAASVWGPGLPPGGVAEGGNGICMCADGRGGLYLAGLGKLWRWSEGTEPVQVAQGDDLNYVSAVNVDAAGRLYFTHKNGAFRVKRYDPASNTWTTVAGKDGRYFSDTSGVDTSLDILDNQVTFLPNGDLLIPDAFHHQIKRIPASGL